METEDIEMANGPAPGFRSELNILITGTPCTGKSTLAAQVSERTNLRHINIGELAKEKQLFEDYDEERKCGVLDDEKVLDEIEDSMDAGGNVVDYHGSEFFPERWFDAVFILRTDNTALFDRLTARGYSEQKVKENVECEIFGVVSDEAKESYPKLDPTTALVELQSNSPDDMDNNIDRICGFIDNWKKPN